MRTSKIYNKNGEIVFIIKFSKYIENPDTYTFKKYIASKKLSKKSEELIDCSNLDLVRLNLHNERLSNINFSGAIFTDCSFTSSTFEHCKFNDAHIYDCEIEKCIFNQCDFNNTYITCNTIQYNKWNYCNMSGVLWKNNNGTNDTYTLLDTGEPIKHES